MADARRSDRSDYLGELAAPGTYIERGQPDPSAPGLQGHTPRRGPGGEETLLHQRPGGQHPHHPPGHELTRASDLDLVADGHLDTGVEELASILRDALVGYPAHGDAPPLPERSRGQCHPQNGG